MLGCSHPLRGLRGLRSRLRKGPHGPAPKVLAVCGAHTGSPGHWCGVLMGAPPAGHSRLVLELELEEIVRYLGPALA